MPINIEQINTILSTLAERLSKGTPSNTEKESFNIFNVLGVETKEVIICRFLGELLNPHGSHGLGPLPLEAFLKDVIDSSYTKADLEDAEVVLEDVIDNNRRVDIAIYIADKVYPIEVKVWAGDQDAQLHDYYNYYFKKYQNNKIYYLTPTRWEPSSDSRGDLKDQIVCLSFEKDISNWLDNILEPMKGYSIRQQSVQTIVEQFKGVISIMCEKNKELTAIKEALGLGDNNNNNDFDKINNIGTLIALLTNSKELLKSIRIKYIRDKLILGNGNYSLEDVNDDDYVKSDRNALLRIVSNGTAIAWICVSTNLYLVANNVKSPSKWIGNDNYYWRYIGPNGIGQKFNLKDMTDLKNGNCSGDINIEDLLNDIKIDG